MTDWASVLEKQPNNKRIALLYRVSLRVLPKLYFWLDTDNFKKDEIDEIVSSIYEDVFLVFASYVPSYVETGGVISLRLGRIASELNENAYSIASNTGFELLSAHAAASFSEELSTFVYPDCEKQHVPYTWQAGVLGAAESAAEGDGAWMNEPLVRDLDAITLGKSAHGLMSLPLWPEGTPEPVQKSWTALKSGLLARGEGWEVWTDWFEARMRGDRPDWERANAYVLEEDVYRDEGPATANAEIARRLGEIDARRLREIFARAGYAEDPDDILARLARGERPPVEAPQARASLAALHAAVANFRATLAAAETATPGIGHNGPPEEDRLTPPERETVEDALESLAKPKPEPEEVARQTRRLALVYDALARRAGIFESGVWNGAGVAAGAIVISGLDQLAVTHGPVVLEALGQLIDAAMTMFGAGPSAAGPGATPPPPSAPSSIST